MLAALPADVEEADRDELQEAAAIEIAREGGQLVAKPSFAVWGLLDIKGGFTQFTSKDIAALGCSLWARDRHVEAVWDIHRSLNFVLFVFGPRRG